MITPQPSVATVWDRPGGGGREVPFGSNSMQHGTAVFEGIRCYRTPEGPALFRLDDHLHRLLGSAHLLGMPHQYDLTRLRAHVLGVAAAAPADCYLRPVLFAPAPRLGVDLSAMFFELATEVWPMLPLGAPSGTGLRVTVSRWRRPSAKSFPTRAKATGTYASSAVARTEAGAAGFDDAIQLDPDSGRVSEATVTNVFGVRDGRLFTPWLQDGPLEGITRASVLALAQELGIPATAGPVDVEDLRTADELFLTGTASELARVIAVDDRRLDSSGPVFDAIHSAFQAAVSGRRYSRFGWLTPVPLPVPQ